MGLCRRANGWTAVTTMMLTMAPTIANDKTNRSMGDWVGPGVNQGYRGCRVQQTGKQTNPPPCPACIPHVRGTWGVCGV